MTNKEFYYVDSVNTKQGPVSSEELLALAQQGIVTPSTLVWEQGTPDWVAARTIGSLATLYAPAAHLVAFEPFHRNPFTVAALAALGFTVLIATTQQFFGTQPFIAWSVVTCSGIAFLAGLAGAIRAATYRVSRALPIAVALLAPIVFVSALLLLNPGFWCDRAQDECARACRLAPHDDTCLPSCFAENDRCVAPYK